MPDSYENLRKRAMKLPYEERSKLSEELWWSLHPPGEDLRQEEIDAAWDAEIERRIGEIDSGNVELISAGQVHEEKRRRFAARAHTRRGE